MMILSVIIPMYKVADFIERCILSLQRQDINQNEYEIICINDGSPDNSRQIVEKLQNEWSNIILINQINLGVSVARNRGIETATGDYIIFIDPDDYVDANTFKNILEKVRKTDAQVSFLGFNFRDKEGRVVKRWWNESLAGVVYTGTKAYFLSRGDGSTDPDRMWAVLFKREFLNRHDLRYLPGVPYLEDGEFIARIMCLAERVIFDGRSFYQRTTRIGSATNSSLFHSDRAHKGFVKAVINLHVFRSLSNLNDEQRAFMNQPVLKFSLLVLQSSGGITNRTKLRNSINLLRRAGLGKMNLKGCNALYRFYGWLFNINPYFALFALFMIPKFKYLIHSLKQ
jgi:glycosyltransferase involved in cell wall biosynthesis